MKKVFLAACWTGIWFACIAGLIMVVFNAIPKHVQMQKDAISLAQLDERQAVLDRVAHQEAMRHLGRCVYKLKEGGECNE